MPIRESREPNLTPRERVEFEWEKEATHLQATLHERQQDHDLEIRKIEVKWTQVFRIPQAIILLPVKVIMSIAIPISIITNHTLTKEYWEFMNG